MATQPLAGGAPLTPAPPATAPASLDVLAELVVYGDPAAQGSHTPFIAGTGDQARARLRERHPKRHRDWRHAVAEVAASIAPAAGGLDGCLLVDATFRFAMPTSRTKRARDRGVAGKYTAPDLDKLQRSVGDALKAGGLIVDDARITEWRVRKLEVTGWTGVHLTISRFDPTPYLEEVA